MNPAITPQDFLNKWNGQIISFTNVPTGSCMAVPHEWLSEAYGITDPSYFYGAIAYDVWSNFTNLPISANFIQIANSATNFPSPGDIIIFAQTPDTPSGHICVCLTANVDGFTSIDQDYPYGSTTHSQNHVYTGTETVAGWLHYNPPTASPTENVTVSNTDIASQLNAEIAALNACQLQLKEANQQITSLQASLTTANSQVKDLQEQVAELQSENISLINASKTLNTNYVAAQGSIISLKKQIVENQSEDLDYSSEALTSSQTVTELQNLLQKIAAVFGIKTGGLTYDQITSKVLSEEGVQEKMAESAHVNLKILQEIGHEVVEKVEDMNAVVLGSKIMQWVRQKKYSATPPPSQSGVGDKTSGNIFVTLGLWKPKT